MHQHSLSNEVYLLYTLSTLIHCYYSKVNLELLLMKITFMKGPLYDIFWHCCKQSLNMDRSNQTVNLQKEVEFYVAMIALLLRKELMEVHKS